MRENTTNNLKKQAVKDILSESILILDGAMGTILQKSGLKIGEKPESFNLSHPEIIENIHYQYLMAGADIVYTNTFGANAIKMPNMDYKAMITAGVKCARDAVARAGHGLVALDIGALGELMVPMGRLTFDRAYEVFAEVVDLVKEDIDLVVLETMSDLYELKAGALAVKENSDLPLFVTMSFDEKGRTFSGCPVEAMVATMEGLGVDALGLNCSLSPSQLKPLVERLTKVSSLPVILKPNAGIPIVRAGETTFDITPVEFSQIMASYADMGASILGGCCGTDYEYIKLLKGAVQGKRTEVVAKDICSVASGLRYLEIDQPVMVGERVNPTGKKIMRQAISERDFAYIQSQAIEQMDAGAHILDVNMGVPNIDEPQMMREAIEHIQEIVDLPLQIDSSDPMAIERGLRYYNGKAIVNSVNGDKKVLDKILPLVKKYGALVVGLTVDENGVPKTFEDRVKIAKRIVKYTDKYGIPRHNVIIDCLTLTAGAEQAQAMLTLKAIAYVKQKLGVKTTLGVSNISFGLPQRAIINKTFLTMALMAGLDFAIINPNLPAMQESYRAYKVLANIDKDSREYIEYYNNVEVAPIHTGKSFSLEECIISSRESEAMDAVKELLTQKSGMAIIEQNVIPALNVVGDGYEKGKTFLPQLISSSDVAKKVCDYIKLNISSENVEKKYKVMLATVEGDVHDIGKNIVKTILQNYGYEIIDLGRDVKVEYVVEQVMEHKPKVLGLSALMTTTVKNMARTIEAVREVDSEVIICVGGAVLNENVAQEIHADYYTKDPQELTNLLAIFDEK